MLVLQKFGSIIDNAYLYGFDIYSATRDANIQFWIKDVQLNGVRGN